jgi:hypothetical protein
MGVRSHCRGVSAANRSSNLLAPTNMRKGAPQKGAPFPFVGGKIRTSDRVSLQPGPERASVRSLWVMGGVEGDSCLNGGPSTPPTPQSGIPCPRIKADRSRGEFQAGCRMGGGFPFRSAPSALAMERGNPLRWLGAPGAPPLSI